MPLNRFAVSLKRPIVSAMDDSPEILASYAEASRPYYELGGAITPKECAMRSWRYFLEINSACNLACPTCTKGNKEGYEHQTGIMDEELMQKCIDKIKLENPEAIVFLYGNSEPFLHPRLAHCIRSVKERGLNAQISTNLNYFKNQEVVLEVLNSGLDFMIISLSGFTQDVYVKGHHGGNIEKVKENMALLGQLRYETGNKFPISVNYHVYNDNQHEVELMKEYAAAHNIGFFTSKARAISMENAIQYCRDHDAEAALYQVQEGRVDLNLALPPIGDKYKAAMERLIISPLKAREMYKDLPIHKVCPVGDMFTFIRHDGKTELCACAADRRITIGDYLDTTANELSAQRRGHSLCQQCQKYRMNLYFHIVDKKQWLE